VVGGLDQLWWFNPARGAGKTFHDLPMDFASVNNGLIDLVAMVTVFNPGHDAHLFFGVVGMDMFFPLLWFDRDGS
jgi:hypothetical protein